MHYHLLIFQAICVLHTELTVSFSFRRYLAPEYAEYGFVSVRTDVYAFGIVLFQLISGGKVLDENRGQCHHLLQWVCLGDSITS